MKGCDTRLRWKVSGVASDIINLLLSSGSVRLLMRRNQMVSESLSQRVYNCSRSCPFVFHSVAPPPPALCLLRFPACHFPAFNLSALVARWDCAERAEMHISLTDSYWADMFTSTTASYSGSFSFQLPGSFVPVSLSYIRSYCVFSSLHVCGSGAIC